MRTIGVEDGDIVNEKSRDYKYEVESAEDARDLYYLGLEMAAEIVRLREELKSAKQESNTALPDGGR